MHRYLLLVFIALIYFFASTSPVSADVDVELSTFAMQDINLMSKVDTSRRGSDKVAFRFQKDLILIKSLTVNMAIDFAQKEISWEEIDKYGRPRNYSYTFRDILDRGSALSDRFIDQETFFKRKNFKKDRHKVWFQGAELGKWKQKLGRKNYTEAWTSSEFPEFREINFLLAALLQRTGVFISVGHSAEWFSALIELDSFPLLIRRFEFKQADKARASVTSDQYYAVTRIGNINFMTPEDIPLISDQRSFFEKIGISLSKFSDRIIEFRMLTPTIVLVILILSPLWYPWLSERLHSNRDHKDWQLRENQKTVIQSYNFLRKIKDAPDKIESVEISQFQKLIDSKVYKKYFSSRERREFKEILERSPDDLEPSDKNFAAGLMKTCDKAIEKIDRKFHR